MFTLLGIRPLCLYRSLCEQWQQSQSVQAVRLQCPAPPKQKRQLLGLQLADLAEASQNTVYDSFESRFKAPNAMNVQHVAIL